MPAPFRTWLWLVGLSLITTLLARFAAPGALWVAPAFLLLAGLKARQLLLGYLGLGASRFWARLFSGFLAAFLLAALALYMLPVWR